MPAGVGQHRCFSAVVGLEHGNGPALLARQHSEGQSMLCGKEASHPLHWLIEIPERIVNKGLFEDRRKLAN